MDIHNPELEVLKLEHLRDLIIALLYLSSIEIILVLLSLCDKFSLPTIPIIGFIIPPIPKIISYFSIIWYNYLVGEN